MVIHQYMGFKAQAQEPAHEDADEYVNERPATISNRRILWSRTAVRKSYQPYCNLMHLLWMIGEDTELKRVKLIYLVIITFRNKHPFYTAYLPYFSLSSFQAGNKRGFSSCLQNEYYQSSCVSFVFLAPLHARLVHCNHPWFLLPFKSLRFIRNVSGFSRY